MSDINKSLQGPEMSLCANFGCSTFDCVRVWMETERDFMHYHVRWFNWLYLVLESIPLLNVVSGSVFWDYYPQLFPIFGFNYFTVFLQALCEWKSFKKYLKNQPTSWTNRLWASLSAFSGTVGYRVLPCLLKVEICENKANVEIVRRNVTVGLQQTTKDDQNWNWKKVCFHLKWSCEMTTGYLGFKACK